MGTARNGAGRRKPDPWRDDFRISRNEHKGSRGWSVIITINGVRHSRYFSDTAHGSTALALLAARAHAHREREAHLEYLALRRRFRPRRNSRSGIPGVARYSSAARGDFWAAYFDDPATGSRRMKRFSVAHHGEEGARQRAVEFRARSLQPLLERLRELEARFLNPDSPASLPVPE